MRSRWKREMYLSSRRPGEADTAPPNDRVNARGEYGCNQTLIRGPKQSRLSRLVLHNHTGAVEHLSRGATGMDARCDGFHALPDGGQILDGRLRVQYRQSGSACDGRSHYLFHRRIAVWPGG